MGLLGHDENINDSQSRTKVEVEMHLPQEQKEVERKKPQKRKLKKDQKHSTSPQDQLKTEVDLAEDVLRKQKIWRHIKLSFLLVLLGGGVILGGYWLFVILLSSQSASPTSVEVSKNNLEVKEPLKPQPLPPKDEVPPVSEESASKQLSNTELAPLRGALVTFSGSDMIWLVEENGELREVDKESVIFNNGQTLSEINPNLIYQLSDRWRNVRRGKQRVEGKVDFDPRVLSLVELLPFIR